MRNDLKVLYGGTCLRESCVEIGRKGMLHKRNVCSGLQDHGLIIISIGKGEGVEVLSVFEKKFKTKAIAVLKRDAVANVV